MTQQNAEASPEVLRAVEEIVNFAKKQIANFDEGDANDALELVRERLLALETGTVGRTEPPDGAR